MAFQSSTSSARPLPLKQRTSSLDTRRDYSQSTWSSLLVLIKLREYFITVDNFSIWRRHLAWAMENGKDLRGYMTQRYSSNMVFMSLLLSTQLGMLFNSAPVTTNVRIALKNGDHFTMEFYAGFMIMISSLTTILSLICVFTAWSMVNAVDENNAHCIFRSSIGQYAAELPGRLIVCSIYSFLLSFILFCFLLLPVGFWSFLLLILVTVGFVHIISVFSAFGRVIMHTGAMGKSRIFTAEYEEFLLPHSLHSNLLVKAQANLANNTSIIRQYRRKQKPIDRHLTEEEMYNHLSGIADRDVEEDIPYRPRADSTVRFADQQPSVVPASKGSSPSNFGNLTPLSDASSQRYTSDASSAPSIPTPPPPPASAFSSKRVPTPPPPTGEVSNLPKKGTPSRPSVPTLSRPPIPSTTPFASATDSLRNVSTSSLEQWLQASPMSGTEGSNPIHIKNSSSSGESPRASFQTISGGSVPQQQLQQQHKQQQRSKGHHKRVGSGFSQQSMDTRTSELTEDERFNLDYGDVLDEGGRLRSGGGSDDDFDVVEYLEDDEERASLLRSGRRSNNNYNSNNNNNYSSMATATAPAGNVERPPLKSGKISPRLHST